MRNSLIFGILFVIVFGVIVAIFKRHHELLECDSGTVKNIDVN